MFRRKREVRVDLILLTILILFIFWIPFRGYTIASVKSAVSDVINAVFK